MAGERSVLVFFYGNPFLARYGALLRCYELIRGLKDIGFKMSGIGFFGGNKSDEKR